MPQKPPGIPITQAARVSTFAQSTSRNQVVISGWPVVSAVTYRLAGLASRP